MNEYSNCIWITWIIGVGSQQALWCCRKRIQFILLIDTNDDQARLTDSSLLVQGSFDNFAITKHKKQSIEFLIELGLCGIYFYELYRFPNVLVDFFNSTNGLITDNVTPLSEQYEIMSHTKLKNNSWLIIIPW